MDFNVLKKNRRAAGPAGAGLPAVCRKVQLEKVGNVIIGPRGTAGCRLGGTFRPGRVCPMTNRPRTHRYGDTEDIMPDQKSI
ncbi:hypothetical protein CENSYa_1448 [Cenarchaeum symbiosum A]|uniref:Uncharacterized protein n=1 Tax=Cenarchaeum symbiosum (strain A) TaxID=414004 RepID=A0RXK3_CENSY|nr:hypothetical protein CENSYa_1448 [Cenarchaeum symbiosum A]